MKLITEDDAKKLVEDCRKLSPGLAAMPEKHATAMIGMALTETNTTIKDIEHRIDEAGLIPPDIVAVFLHYGAVVAIVEDLPATDERRLLVAAGREIGKLIAAKFGQKIKATLTKKEGGN